MKRVLTTSVCWCDEGTSVRNLADAPSNTESLGTFYNSFMAC